MKRLIGFKMAGNILLAGMALLILLHILIVLRVVPYDLVWGGQIADASDLLGYEAAAFIITLLFAWVIAMRVGYLPQPGALRWVARIGVWVVFAYYVLNLLGNLASGISAETYIFAPVTLVLALLALRVALE